DHAQRGAAAVGLGDIAGKLLVREVRIVLEGAGRLDHVDALSTFALRQLAAPDRRVERAGEVDPRQLAVGVVRSEARREQVARSELGAGAVVERAGRVLGVGHGRGSITTIPRSWRSARHRGGTWPAGVP